MKRVLEAAANLGLAAGAVVLLWISVVRPFFLEPKSAETRWPTEVTLDGAPTLGSRSARVALVEYSDFECPFCARFARTTLQSLEKEYVATGKVLLSFRHVPLADRHPHAVAAAQAAECARRQDHFWQMHDLLFSGQADLDRDGFANDARSLGLDAGRFSKCLDGEAAARVAAESADARRLRISATPTFLFGVLSDGTVRVATGVAGAKPIGEFRAILDRLLLQPSAQFVE